MGMMTPSEEILKSKQLYYNNTGLTRSRASHSWTLENLKKGKTYSLLVYHGAHGGDTTYSGIEYEQLVEKHVGNSFGASHAFFRWDYLIFRPKSNGNMVVTISYGSGSDYYMDDCLLVQVD